MKTIVNISTPQGVGSIAVIRLSGKNSFKIIKKIFLKNKFNKNKNKVLGYIRYKKKIIDEVILLLYKNPNSYTGENVVEICCHGSIYIQKKIIKIILKLGARLSKNGEFTFRAFINKKINLLQAQNINNLILCESKIDHKISIYNFKKNNYKYIKNIKKKFIKILSYLEYYLDFSESNEILYNKNILFYINSIFYNLKKIIKYFKIYKLNKKFYKIILIGNTNVGKSTLFNALLNNNRSIVSNIKGTTRDYLIENIIINKLKIKIIDTAGYKNIKNKLEKFSIKNTNNLIKKSNLILFIFTIKNFKKNYKLYNNIKKQYKNKKIIKILNKIDLYKKYYIKKFTNYIKISAKKKTGIKKLKKKIKYIIKKNNINKYYKKFILTNSFYINYINLTLKKLKKIKKQIIDKTKYYDLIYIDILTCIKYLNYILGININNKNILKTIFKKFCLGK
ncbi:MAG: tRNA uridine-5-carboxymethylaminomethyl(34) synthesis GTPase MnmE [Candidatus Shikimatogenerans sp. AspAUS03]|uniref:tRNA modification GTPase MnmE n=1 Tax=Candidatus Shikimatogenerans sp. AspAUS03 TaxID=3158563 RepID=A0AAU7QSH6_9FLAO